MLFLYLTSRLSNQPGELLKGLADLIRSLAWPAVVAFLLMTFRTPISSQFGRISKIVVPGGSIELEKAIAKELEISAAETKALPEHDSGKVTPGDISRARAIERSRRKTTCQAFAPACAIWRLNIRE